MKAKKILKLYCVATLLGLLTGLIACLFQLAIHGLDTLLAYFYRLISLKTFFLAIISGVISLLMVSIAWFTVHFLATEASGSGVPEIEGALLHKRPVYWQRLLPVKFFAGMLAISSKMVLGREGPTIQMGGNLGKMLGDFFHLNIGRTDTLIAAGSAAGLAAAFNAPLAGVLFVMEEMRNQFNYSFTDFKIVIICCVSATICLHLIMGNQPAISMQHFDFPSLQSLWLFLIFGILVGFMGLVFNTMLIKTLQCFDGMRLKRKIFYVLIVSFTVGTLAIIYPDVVGSGYTIIDKASSLFPTLPVVGFLFLVRFIMTMLSYSTGVPGGIFAPMLALGTLLGIASYQIFTHVVADLSIHPGMFAIAGMSAFFAATIRSPITGVVLVVEMTQNYLLILPLMVTCVASTTVVQLAGNEPIYSQLLRRTLSLNRKTS